MPREAPPRGCPKIWVFEVEIWPFPCPKIGFSRPKFTNTCPQFGFLRVGSATWSPNLVSMGDAQKAGTRDEES